MRVPSAPPEGDHASTTSSEEENARGVDRRSTMTSVALAVVLSLCALGMSTLEDSYEMRSYTQSWQEADCKVLDERMDIAGRPQGPPDIDIPDEPVVRSPSRLGATERPSLAPAGPPAFPPVHTVSYTHLTLPTICSV